MINPILLFTICLFLLINTDNSDAASEYVTVQKVMDDSAIIVRQNGSIYLIQKGVGCLSLWRYEGKSVVINSPGLFLGVGSTLILPDQDQKCRIWESEKISGAPSPSIPSSPTIQNPRIRQAIDEFSFFDSQGKATAYLDFSDYSVFYLWSGEPLAYLDGESIYGFNGKHLGWYQRGLIYDHEGNVVAAPASAFKSPVDPTPPRGLKNLKPLKGLKELKPLKPLFGLTWSDLPARAFFFLGRD